MLWSDVGMYEPLFVDFMWCKKSGTLHVYGHQKLLDVEHVDGKIFTFLHRAKKLGQLVSCRLSSHNTCNAIIVLIVGT